MPTADRIANALGALPDAPKPNKIVKQVTTAFERLGSNANAKGQARFMPGLDHAYGVRVPDVRMHSEAAAVALITRAGLVPGQRSPLPRPASGRSEVVMRTRPREGTLVRGGTRVDYELLPGEPRARTKHESYVDHDSAACLEAEVEPAAPDAVAVGPPPYVDCDVIDTLFRSGRRPVEGRA